MMGLKSGLLAVAIFAGAGSAALAHATPTLVMEGRGANRPFWPITFRADGCRIRVAAKRRVYISGSNCSIKNVNM